MKRLLLLSAFLLVAIGSLCAEEPAPPKPNVVLILADDLGFSDLGCYGGEIATPQLDSLAAGGVRFTQFYNTARCWPSRAAIMTGYYAQQVRRDSFPPAKNAAKDAPPLPKTGSNGTRPAWAKLLSERLAKHGYHSYHSGKWHIDGLPLANGFEHSYSLNDHDRHFSPRQHTADDKPLPTPTPESGYYTSTAIVDHAVDFLKLHAKEHHAEPFFAFVAFTAPHFPLHAPAADVARYSGKYLAGWDSLRDERWRRMQSFGIGGSRLAAIERDLGPPYPYPAALEKLGPNEVNRPVAWNDLKSEQQTFQAAKMAVHAAMVDRMDREIGRVVEQLKAMNAFDNTLILFLSDNGASAEMMVRGDGHDPTAECGSCATFLSLGPGWSSIANAPFRRHKTWVHEGGISTPLVAHWPRGIAARGALRHAPAHVIDLAPTILELAGGAAAKINAEPGAPSAPGKSLAAVLAEDIAVARDSIWWLHEKNRALRQGDWKIVASGQESPWELYDLSNDRSETHNVAAEQPQRVRQLAELWQRQTDEYRALAVRPDADSETNAKPQAAKDSPKP